MLTSLTSIYKLYRPFCGVLFAVFLVSLMACGTQEESATNTESSNISKGDTYAFDTQYLMGKFDPEIHPDFVLIDTSHADRDGLLLRKEVYEAFLAMNKLAEAQGIDLVIRSATRNFDYQKGIWERKWNGETLIEGGKNASVAYPDVSQRASAILKYSSMPGTSRHHWGTDIDLNAFENNWFEHGEGQQVYAFLVENGSAFGFCQPYSPKGPDRRDGYEEERWHWSFMPTVSKLMRLAKDSLTNDMIVGFNGAETAQQINVVQKYVFGISEDCH